MWYVRLIFQLGGGYLFGLPVGFVADSIGATIGATAAFILGRTVSFSLFNHRFSCFEWNVGLCCKRLSMQRMLTGKVWNKRMILSWLSKLSVIWGLKDILWDLHQFVAYIWNKWMIPSWLPLIYVIWGLEDILSDLRKFVVYLWMIAPCSVPLG